MFDTLGLGEGHEWGYFGAFIIGGIMSAYVMYGFDTAGTLAEETNDPRKQRAAGDHQARSPRRRSSAA